MLHLVFTFQPSRSCNIQPQTPFSPSIWGTRNGGLTQLFPPPFLYLFLFFSQFFALRVSKRNNVEIGVLKHRRSLGGKAEEDDEVEGGLECKV